MRQRRGCAAIVSLALFASAAAANRTAGQEAPSRDVLIATARAVIEAAPFASLASLDEDGRPSVRAMDPLAPDDDMVVWLATNPLSRKVGQLRANPTVALHYLDAEGPGYVTLYGTARLVDDPAEKRSHWKDAWTPFYDGGPDGALLIEVSPLWLEVVSTSHGANGDPTTWAADVVEFVPGSSGRE